MPNLVVHDQAIVVTCRGATHPRVIKRMRASRLLMPGGYRKVEGNDDMVVILPKPHVSGEHVTSRLAIEIVQATASSQLK